MTLYQPMHGWDATILIKLNSGETFSDASEIYGIKFDEAWNLEKRKQLGVKIKESMPGVYEASGSATAYMITSEMVSENSKRSMHPAFLPGIALRVIFPVLFTSCSNPARLETVSRK